MGAISHNELAPFVRHVVPSKSIRLQTGCGLAVAFVMLLGVMLCIPLPPFFCYPSGFNFHSTFVQNTKAKDLKGQRLSFLCDINELKVRI